MNLHPLQIQARELKNRMRNPPNGRMSSELEVVSESRLRKIRARKVQAQRALDDADRVLQRALDDVVRQEVARHAEVMKIAQVIATEEQSFSISSILQAVANYYGVTVVDICSNRRNAEILRPRQVTMYLCRTMTFQSMPAIGRKIGKRDHTTVLHGYRKIKRLLERDEKMQADIAAIKAALGAE